jgi:hypothetical protein
MAKKNTPPIDDSNPDESGTDTNRPVMVFRLKGNKASVFRNVTRRDGRDEVWHRIALTRVYRQGEEWKTARGSLNRDDIPIARLLLARAWEWVLRAEADGRNPQAPQEP